MITETISQSTIPKSELAKALLERRKMREKLDPFVRKAFETLNPNTPYKYNWHIGLLCEYLEAVFYGEIRRLLLNIQPRNLKSTICSIGFPAWGIGKIPSKQFLCASYADPLAVKHAVECRNVIKSEWYQVTFPELRLSSDQNEKREFTTTRGGHRIATSVGGSSTGKGGDILIGDDLLKIENAYSKRIRDATNDWIDQTFLGRLNDKKTGAVVIISQRTHLSDPTGWLESKPSIVPWTKVSIPTEAEKKTVIHFKDFHIVREEGDILHEEREGEKEIQQAKIDLGSYGYAAQYQQRPSPLGGGFFKVAWWKEFESLRNEPIYAVLQSWDTAFDDTESAAYSCCTTWIKIMNYYLLADVYRQKLEFPDLKKAFKLQHAKFAGQPFLDSGRILVPDVILIERKASGISLIQEMKRETDLPIIDIQPEGDKLSRAIANSPLIEAGNVALLKGAPWAADFIQEHADFPNADYADQVDSTSQALKYLKTFVGSMLLIGDNGDSYGIGETIGSRHEEEGSI